MINNPTYKYEAIDPNRGDTFESIVLYSRHSPSFIFSFSLNESRRGKQLDVSYLDTSFI